MKKGIIIFALSVVIILTFSQITLSTLAKGDEGNFFNSKLRAKFAKYPVFRTLLSLHDPGDANYEYLTGKNSKILIEVDEMKGLAIPSQVLGSLAKKISALTGKNVSYIVSDINIPFEDRTGEDEIKQISKRYKNFASNEDQAVIYLLYLNESSDSDTVVGETYQDYGIVLFDLSIQYFALNFPRHFNDYMQSTALHEFGHLIGLNHNDRTDCLMQPVADDYDFFAPNDGVITDFCDFELDQIKQIKNNL